MKTSINCHSCECRNPLIGTGRGFPHARLCENYLFLSLLRMQESPKVALEGDSRMRDSVKITFSCHSCECRNPLKWHWKEIPAFAERHFC
ncbi:MAG: hypothetical protein NT007_10925 [Candidatus Kapabacteria bacterium]|nr:hypothetical protein [Candidatus Kapabacteria bacterium]